MKHVLATSVPQSGLGSVGMGIEQVQPPANAGTSNFELRLAISMLCERAGP